ncbi:uncharacterized protein TNCV_3339691 [Trichonephila clavipes]|nr:uncharacterized protein TNCV_3339691 [Trichonephila clavipes]
MRTSRKWYTQDFLMELQKLHERAPTSKDAGLTPPAEGLSNISKYPGHLPDIASYDGNPRNQGLVGVDRRAGQFTGPPRPIHRPGYAVSNALHTSALKCTGAPSCWDHIRAFRLAGTLCSKTLHPYKQTATSGTDAVQSGRPIFDDFFQHLWPYIGNNTANVVFQMVKRLWLIRIDQ